MLPPRAGKDINSGREGGSLGEEGGGGRLWGGLQNRIGGAKSTPENYDNIIPIDSEDWVGDANTGACGEGCTDGG